ncbi:hypothetical protein HDV03_003562 [Kappamyces sp. JEL0829]|nr:hypothetical protein HDV03_003562 [Kappamyces sp. JEL0829]
MNPSLASSLFKAKTSREHLYEKEAQVQEFLDQQALGELSSASAAYFESDRQEVLQDLELSREWEQEAKLLAASLQEFKKNLALWLTVAKKSNDEIKELGDLELFSKSIQQQIEAICRRAEANASRPTRSR